MKNITKYAVWAVFVLAAYLSVAGLGNVEFWDDEVETAWMSKAVLETGRPFAWDGRNTHDYGDGLYLNDRYENMFPPVSIFTGALSFKMFGVSEGGGRALFGIIGIACLGVFLLLLRLEVPDDPRLRLAAFSVFSLSPVYLLHTRQMRYYAPALLLTLLAFYLYRVYVKRHRESGAFPWSVWACSVCCFLLFMTHFATAAAFFGAFGVSHLLFVSERRRPEWHLWLAALITAAACFAYLLWTGYITPEFGVRTNVFSVFYMEENRLVRIWSLLPLYLRFINAGGLAPWFVVLWVVWLAAKTLRGRARDDDATPLYYGATGVFLVSVCAVVSPQQEYDHYAATRFFFNAFPFFAVATAFFCLRIFKLTRAGGGAVLIALILLTTLPAWPFGVQNSPPLKGNYSPLRLALPAWKSVNIFSFENSYTSLTLPAMAAEFHSKRPTFLGGLKEFFEKNGSQDEVITVFPAWASYNTVWYLGKKFLFSRPYARQYAVPDDVLTKYGVEIRTPDKWIPDWIVLAGPAKNPVPGRILAMNAPDMETGGVVSFPSLRGEKYVLVKKLNRLYFPVWRPELFWHSFGRPVDVGADPRRGDVFIFRRKI